MDDFIKALCTSAAPHPITAYFKNGSTADYTINILDLLTTDPEVLTITDGATGEIIFNR